MPLNRLGKRATVSVHGRRRPAVHQILTRLPVPSSSASLEGWSQAVPTWWLVLAR